MKVVVSEFMDRAAFSAFAGIADVLYDPALVNSPADLAAAVIDADALIVRNRTQVNAALLESADRLRVIGRLGVGLDNIDLDLCRSKGIAVRPATGANTLSVAEYVISAALSLTRGTFASNAEMLAGEWPRAALIGGEVSGRVMGLVGYGEIARAVAARASSLGMEVAAFDPFIAPDDPVWSGVSRCSFPHLLASTDVLSLHVPLTAETRSLIDTKALGTMKPTAVLINTARGGVVNEAALASALRRGLLGGAALDVFEVEPLTTEAAKKFAGCPNLILTPHIAGVTREGNVRVSAVTVAAVIEELARWV